MVYDVDIPKSMIMWNSNWQELVGILSYPHESPGNQTKPSDQLIGFREHFDRNIPWSSWENLWTSMVSGEDFLFLSTHWFTVCIFGELWIYKSTLHHSWLTHWINPVDWFPAGERHHDTARLWQRALHHDAGLRHRRGGRICLWAVGKP